MQHAGDAVRGSWKNATRPRGVLDLRAGRRWFDAAQHRPSPDLTDLIEHYWRVRWDVRDHGPYTQHTLSNASVHLVVEGGVYRVQGIVTGRFTRVLEGQGRVFGVKFRPAGFHPFHASAVSALTDRSVAISEVFGEAGEALAEQILALDDDARIVDLCNAFFHDRRPASDPQVRRVNEIVARIVDDHAITSVEQVARTAGIGKRTLQRLFSEYVGVSPKWVIRRYRLHEAEERLASGDEVDLASLALDLGYYDQAHLANDFQAIVGRAPAAYRRSAADTD
jgi:AraC-like DNA-binding protein